MAQSIAAKPLLARRYARAVLTQRIKRLMDEGITQGLALEALAKLDELATEGQMAGLR